MSDISPIFTIAQGSTRRIAFRFRLWGVQGYWDVSGASAITLGWEPHGGSPQTPIVANPSDPYANWQQGLVVFWVTANDVTAAVATVDCTVQVVTNDGQTILEPVGAIEITYSPGFGS